MSGDRVEGSSFRSRVQLAVERVLPLRETVEPATHPFVPRTRDQLPEAAWPDLESVCPNVPLERLFVIPTVMMTRGRRMRAMTPSHVLAFGDRVVALWSEDRGKRRLSRLPTDELLAVDDRSILLDGRLSLIAAHDRIVVPYNTVSRALLRENVRRLRCAIAGDPCPTTSAFVWVSSRGESGGRGDLPYKWSYLLECEPNLRLDPEEPAMVAVGDVVELGHHRVRRRARRPASGVAILGARELAIAVEPVESLEHGRYGVDLTTVPRRFVHHLAWDGRALLIRLQSADGTPAGEIVRPMDRLLVEAMRRSFREAVAWA